jgi:ABC-type transport system involved in multi-copper enzyme maturation permease subunit
MRNLFIAEWQKIVGHRWAVGTLIFIFPVVSFVFIVLATVAALIDREHASAQYGFVTNSQWTDNMLSAWDTPSHFFGRMLILAFTAILFAGEYQWGTWRNIIPRSSRIPLVLTKYVALGVFVVLAFGAMSLIMGIGMAVPASVVGATYGPELTGDTLREFVGDYALKAGLAFISTLIVVSYAALAAMFTRSIVGGVVAGIAASFLEGVIGLVALLLANVLNAPDLVQAFRLTPVYCVLNFSAWVNSNASEVATMYVRGNPVEVGGDPLVFSIAVLAVWLFGLMAVTIALFQRQDIAS